MEFDQQQPIHDLCNSLKQLCLNTQNIILPKKCNETEKNDIEEGIKIIKKIKKIEKRVCYSNKAIQFTRYLYLKEHVFWSLHISILKHKYDEILYWGYELFFSGWIEDIITYMIYLFETYAINTIYQNILQQKIQQFIDYKQIENIANVFINISKCLCFYKDKCNSNLPQYIEFSKNDVECYETLEVGQTIVSLSNCASEIHIKSAWQILTNALQLAQYKFSFDNELGISTYPENILNLFQLQTNFTSTQYMNILHNDEYWIYMLYFTPFWKNKLDNFINIIMYENDMVKYEFKDDECKEQFYKLFGGLEPDEQPKWVFDCWIKNL